MKYIVAVEDQVVTQGRIELVDANNKTDAVLVVAENMPLVELVNHPTFYVIAKSEMEVVDVSFSANGLVATET